MGTTTTNTEVSGDSDRQTGDQGEDADNIVIIVVAICLIVIVLGLSALFGLHYKRMLPQGFYKVFSARWKPVNTDMDLEEEPSEKPIIKNGAAAINGDCTVVTYVGEKEEDDVEEAKETDPLKDESESK